MRASGGADVALDDDFESEATSDFGTPREDPSQPAVKAPDGARGERDSSEGLSALTEFSAEDAPRSESIGDQGAVGASLPQDLTTDPPGALMMEHDFEESPVDSNDPAVEETPQVDASTENTTPEIPAPVLVALPLKSGMGPRAMAMGVLGVAGAAFLVFAMLSTRGAASPEATAVPSQPQGTAAVQPRPASREVQSREPLAPLPAWNSNPAAWAGSERKSAAFELPSVNKVQVWMRQVQPMLVVRCRAGATEVFVFTNSPAKMEPQDGDHTVRIRFDANPLVTERWPDSAEHDALFAPDGAAFLQQVIGARKLEFGFSPHNSSPVVASFEVTGLVEHLAGAAKPCGWKTQ